VDARTPIHLRPSAELAERVLLPGDPHRALAVAQALLDSPRMFNHTRGLWGYTGRAPDGEPLTVQATGMGGPSAAIVAEELLDLGARTLIRIGTCGALVPGFELGEMVVAHRVVGADGASAALSAAAATQTRESAPAPALTRALKDAGARPATVVTTDLFYDPREGVREGWRGEGAEVVEMEAAAILGVAARRGGRAAVLLGVSDLLAGESRRRIGREALDALGVSLGRTAYAALATEPRGA